MKIIEPFDNANLASHIIRMVPKNLQDQYKLSGATVPKSVWKLLEPLGHIEKACPTNKDCEGPNVSTMRRMIPFDERIPKRHCKEKHCSQCKQHGGPHMIHNTLECQKYESNGTPKKKFYGKDARGKTCGPKNLVKKEVAMCNYPLKSRD
jgi:hypothetical protein